MKPDSLALACENPVGPVMQTMRLVVSMQLMRCFDVLNCSKSRTSMSPAIAWLPAGWPQGLPGDGARFFHVLEMGSVGLYWNRSKHSHPLPVT
jgi:hypothetical protein